MPRIYQRNCDNCGEIYKRASKRFCSKDCFFLAFRAGKVSIGFKKGHPFYGESVKGKHWKLSEETKQKHREMIKEKSPNWGRKWSVEVRAKMSASRRGKRTGANNNLWKGGKTEVGLMIRTSSQYSDWRLKVYMRDSFTCQECGMSGVPLNADHITRFSKHLGDFLEIYKDVPQTQESLLPLAFKYQPFWNTKNGRTLCVPCHRKTPTYGKQKALTSFNLSL